jgi:hypothetical protein
LAGVVAGGSLPQQSGACSLLGDDVSREVQVLLKLKPDDSFVS